ncbi:unnamed protein product [Meganyctiphanes norvegica]|uniref:Uncharacterized protein n=1 Tax=Meganyctiphanes norvegica TaxID=48144 RepID=A0AAV2QLG7_MEGNR
MDGFISSTTIYGPPRHLHQWMDSSAPLQYMALLTISTNGWIHQLQYQLWPSSPSPPMDGFISSNINYGPPHHLHQWMDSSAPISHMALLTISTNGWIHQLQYHIWPSSPSPPMDGFISSNITYGPPQHQHHRSRNADHRHVLMLSNKQCCPGDGLQ